MKKHIIDETTGIHYTLRGEQYWPDLALLDEEERPVGIWGQRHLQYIQQHKRMLYTELLTSGRLNKYLAEVDEQAEAMFSRLVKQMAEREGVTENLKAESQIEWITKMNNIRSRAMETVNAELIFG